MLCLKHLLNFILNILSCDKPVICCALMSSSISVFVCVSTL